MSEILLLKSFIVPKHILFASKNPSILMSIFLFYHENYFKINFEHLSLASFFLWDCNVDLLIPSFSVIHEPTFTANNL